MAEKYLCILRTYIRLPSTKQSFLPACGVLSLLLSFLFCKRTTSSLSAGWTVNVALAIAFLGFPIWIRFRQHLLSARREVWPNYVRPHLVVFGLIATSLTLIWPLALLLISGRDEWGLIAVVTALFGVMGYAVVTQSALMAVVWMAAYLLYVLTPDGGVTSSILRVNSPLTAAGILVAGLLFCGRSVFLLLKQEISDSLSSANAQAGWLRDLKEYFFHRNATYPFERCSSVLATSKRWLVTAPINSWNWLLIFAIQMISVAPWRSQSPASSVDSVRPIITGLLAFSSLYVCVGWMQQWKYREVELLRPVTRRRFFLEIGVAIAVQVARIWSICLAIALCVLYVVGASTMRSMVLWVLLQSCSLVFVYGISVWAIRFRAISLIGGLVAVPSTLAGVAIIFVLPMRWIHAPAMSVGMIAMLAGGVAMMCVAYRQWLNTELG